MNAIIKYPGSKWSKADWIISHFPAHHSYLEPFLGSGAVLFNKPRSNIETVNDLDGDVINLFEWIRRDPERLATEIYMIPYARSIYDKAWADQYVETDSFNRAINFYVRMMMGHGFRTTGEKVGWKNDVQGREKAYAAQMWGQVPDVIMEAADRLRGVQIESQNAAKLIQRFNYPNVLIYADPPYVLSSRSSKRAQYRCEMDDDAHAELLCLLRKHSGPVLISGYDTQMYRAELAGWYCESISSRAQTGGARVEMLWMNFEPT